MAWMRPLGGRAARYLLVAVLVVVSMLGVPAVLSVFSRDRARAGVQVELVVGQEAVRLPVS
jgi:hypothetical protein